MRKYKDNDGVGLGRCECCGYMFTHIAERRETEHGFLCSGHANPPFGELREMPYIRWLADLIRQPDESLEAVLARLDAMSSRDLDALWDDTVGEVR